MKLLNSIFREDSSYLVRQSYGSKHIVKQSFEIKKSDIQFDFYPYRSYPNLSVR